MVKPVPQLTPQFVIRRRSAENPVCMPGRLETKDDEKRLADECRLLGPLLGGTGKRGEKCRLTLAKIVRGIASGEVRRYCEGRERLLRVSKPIHCTGRLQTVLPFALIHRLAFRNCACSIQGANRPADLITLLLKLCYGNGVAEAHHAPEHQPVCWLFSSFSGI